MDAILLHQFHLVLSLPALPHVGNIIILTGQTFVQNVFHYSKLPDVYDTTAWNNNIQYTFFVSMFICFLILSHFINYMHATFSNSSDGSYILVANYSIFNTTLIKRPYISIIMVTTNFIRLIYNSFKCLHLISMHLTYTGRMFHNDRNI